MANENTKEQIALQQQLKALLEENAKLIAQIESGAISGRTKIERVLREQKAKVRQLGDEMGAGGPELLKQNKELKGQIESISKAQEKATKTNKRASGSVMGLMKEFGPAGLGAALVGTTAAITGMTKGLDMAGKSFTLLGQPILQARSAITKDLGAVLDEQGNYAQNLAGRTAKAQIEFMNEMAKTPKGLATTEPVMRAFSQDLGQAQKQLADRTAQLRQAFQTEMGALNKSLDSSEAVSQIIALQEALGATPEELSAASAQAQITGNTIEGQLGLAALAADKFSKRYGVDFKQVSKATNTLRKDFAMFGTFSEEQLAKVAASAVKLGVSLQGIKKMEIHDSFDTAAEKAAMLGQSFGLNIDAFDLFMEEDPTERLRMIQEAASQAGLDIANMSRVEMKHLADLTGMGVEDTMKALSDSGQNLRSQLGVAEEGKVAAEDRMAQNARMIEVQDNLATTIDGLKEQIAVFGGDSMETMLKAQRDLLLMQGDTQQRLGESQLSAVQTLATASGELITSNQAVRESMENSNRLVEVFINKGTGVGQQAITATGDVLDKTMSRVETRQPLDAKFAKSVFTGEEQKKLGMSVAKMFNSVGNAVIEGVTKAVKTIKPSPETIGLEQEKVTQKVEGVFQSVGKVAVAGVNKTIEAVSPATATVPITAGAGGRLEAGAPSINAPVPIALTVNLVADNNTLATAVSAGTPAGESATIGQRTNQARQVGDKLGVSA